MATIRGIKKIEPLVVPDAGSALRRSVLPKLMEFRQAVLSDVYVIDKTAPELKDVSKCVDTLVRRMSKKHNLPDAVILRCLQISVNELLKEPETAG